MKPLKPGNLGPHTQSLGSSELLLRLALEPMADAVRERIAKQQTRMAAAIRDLACTAELHPDRVACDAGPLLRQGSWNLPRCTHVTFAWEGIERRYCVDLKRLRAAGKALRKYKPELVFDESGVCLRWTHPNGLRGGLTFWGNEHPAQSLVIKVPLAAAIDMRSRVAA
jgi:hypothetical protein